MPIKSRINRIVFLQCHVRQWNEKTATIDSSMDKDYKRYIE